METELPTEDPAADTIVTVGEPPSPAEDNTPSEAVNLAPFFDKEALAKLSQSCLDDVETDKKSRSRHMANLEKWQKVYAGEYETESGPFRAVPKINAPLLAYTVTQVFSRMWDTLLPSDGRWFLSKPSDAQDVDRAHRTELYVDIYVRRDIPEFGMNMYDAIWQVVLNGDSWIKIYWNLYEKRICCDVVNVEDLILPYRVRYVDPTMRNYPRYAHVIRYTYHQLQRMEEDGIFVGVKDIDINDNDSDDRSNFQAQVDKVAGQDPSSDGTPEDQPRKVLECYRQMVMPKSPKHELMDGKLHYVIVTIDHKSHKVLRVSVREEDEPRDLRRYMREMQKYEEAKMQGMPAPLPVAPRQREVCSFVNLGGWPSAGAYNLGFGAMVGPLNIAINEYMRQIAINLAMSNAPPAFKKRNFKMQTGDITTGPGKVIEVDTSGPIKDGIEFISPPPVASGTYSMIEGIKEMAHRYTGAGEVFSGEPSGANETAKGMTIRNVEANKAVTVQGRRLRESLKYVALAIWSRLHVFMDEEEFVKVATEDGSFDEAKVSRADFIPDADVVPAADPRLGSRVQETEEAMQMVQAAQILQPLQAPPIQLAITEEVLIAMHRPAIARKVREMGEAMMAQQQQPEPPKPEKQFVENAGFLMGKDHPVMPEDNDDEHMAEMDVFEQDDRGFGLLTPEMKQAYMQHKSMHAAKKLLKERGMEETLEQAQRMANGDASAAIPPS